jgi:alkaline phosphatase D
MKKYLFILIISAVSTLTKAQFPANIYADSAHAPFIHGVCSGDPTDSSLIIWTYIEPDADSFSMSLIWQISSDTSFTNIIQSGSIQTDSLLDYTVKIDVPSLSAGSVYYYRFLDYNGNSSIWGRGKTLPSGNIASAKIAAMSCSSIFSGFFNAYRRIAERDDLQLIVHLGDYIYDFVDANEEVRVPNPYPVDCASRAEWIDRYKYYLLDPDLREARRMQTWYAYWDNHDIDSDSAYVKEIFRRWLPIRETPEVTQNLLYRSLKIGDLADITMLDVESLRNIDTFPNGEYNLMGNQQFEWATQILKNSDTRWHLMGSQKMVGGWYTRGIDPGLLNLVPNDGDVFDNGSWDGFDETRNRLYDTLIVHNIDNCLMLSGDAHITMAMDLVKDPYDSIAYNAATGSGAVGCEFLPSSITRGNFDESGIPASLSPFFMGITLAANPHHQHMEINSHGYGLIEIFLDSIVATPYYSDILTQTNIETAGQRLIMKNGTNHWERIVSASNLIEEKLLVEIFPNPANDKIYVKLPESNGTVTKVLIYNSLGQLLIEKLLSQSSEILVDELQNGLYYLVFEQSAKKRSASKLHISR